MTAPITFQNDKSIQGQAIALWFSSPCLLASVIGAASDAMRASFSGQHRYQPTFNELGSKRDEQRNSRRATTFSTERLESLGVLLT
ncbi:MAG TPA: hypothetical protein VF600_17250 [Abditibacteriaceae bacterium]|jgi:hypothetical protein